jgi:hypothetical protein
VTTVACPRPAQVRIDEADFYLTNEVFLYRFLGFVEGGADDVIELEDCYALDVVRVPFDDLCERRLRVVTPAPA